MPISLRIPPEREAMISEAARKEGKTKTAFILEAIDEKLGIRRERAARIRSFAGWMTREEADELREAMEPFERIHEGDWE